MTNLEPYGINSDDFMKASNISSTLASLWLSKIDIELKDEIVFQHFYKKQENLLLLI